VTQPASLAHDFGLDSHIMIAPCYFRIAVIPMAAQFCSSISQSQLGPGEDCT
jgi:hypothetical protein